VSAAHVLDATSAGGVHLLLNGREQHPLANPTWLTLTKHPGSRRDDLVDTGYVRLTDAEIQAIGRESFLKVRQPVLVPEVHWAARHILFGFPSNRQSRDDVGMKVDLQLTYFSSPEIPVGKYATYGLNRVHHFGMRFEGSRIASKRGRGGQPNFRGMSGGGVWIIDPYTDYSETNYPAFAGLLLGPAPKTNKALFGSRIAALFAMLDAETVPQPSNEELKPTAPSSSLVE
jgi:hypothetical protein